LKTIRELSWARQIFLILAFLIISLTATSSAESANIKVLILPFEMFGNADLSNLRRNVMETMARELTAQGAEVAGIELLKDLVLNQGVKEFDEETAIGILD
jgi:hypothetical protein